MLKNTMMEPIQCVESVVAVDAVISAGLDAWERKPKELKRQTFFGEYDLWHYIPIFDEKLCDDCLAHSLTTYFLGARLRENFKYLKIKDENTIYANVHPNCRCILIRVTNPYEYLWVSTTLLGL